MVGDDGVGLDDAHEDVGRSGTGAQAGEIRTLRTAVVAEAVALRAERGGEHLLAVGEVERLLGLSVVPSFEGFGVRPETAGAGSGRERFDLHDGRDRLEARTVGFRHGRQGLLADITDEALQ